MPPRRARGDRGRRRDDGGPAGLRRSRRRVAQRHPRGLGGVMSAARQPGTGAAPLVSERREEILAIAAKIFADKGYASTTVREIADAAGILSGSLYHHFDSKE